MTLWDLAGILLSIVLLGHQADAQKCYVIEGEHSSNRPRWLSYVRGGAMAIVFGGSEC
jgi:hypothetical protein